MYKTLSLISRNWFVTVPYETIIIYYAWSLRPIQEATTETVVFVICEIGKLVAKLVFVAAWTWHKTFVYHFFVEVSEVVLCLDLGVDGRFPLATGHFVPVQPFEESVFFGLL